MGAGLFAQGIELLLVGMGTVFAFLTVLVIVTSLMSRLIVRYLPEPGPVMAPPRAQTAPDDQQIVAVIAAAIRAHRSRSSE